MTLANGRFGIPRDPAETSLFPAIISLSNSGISRTLPDASLTRKGGDLPVIGPELASIVMVVMVASWRSSLPFGCYTLRSRTQIA
jgi:hypothetical protein